jgi:hypothetical protein
MLAALSEERGKSSSKNHDGEDRSTEIGRATGIQVKTISIHMLADDPLEEF